MARPLEVLIVEDSREDADLFLHELRRAGFQPRHRQVQTAGDFVDALEHGHWEIVLSDYSMPQFDAMAALQLLRKHSEDIPFIVVTGTIDEETAVDCLKRGADNYILKENLGRLAPAVRQVLEAYEDRRQRLRAEEALRESERRLRSVLDGLYEAPVGLCFLDRELRYVYVNEWLAKLDGSSVEEHLGRTIREVVPKVAAGAESQLRHVLETGEPIIDGIVEVETPADPSRKRIFQHNYYPVVADDGTVIGVSCAVQDVTERKRADEQIRKQQHQLEHLSRIGTMGEMATGFAHELNQPLASIVNYTKGCVRRIQAGRPDPQELVAALNDASSEAERAGEIIKRIRRFVRKREPARTTIDIAELIGQVLDLMRSDLQHQSIQTRLEVEEHMPTLQGDRIQLQQVLVNLLRNSIEAMNETEMEHRHLTIGAATDNEDSVTLFVRDRGCGLGEVDPDSIFEPFFTTRKDGTGMGLAISRTIIEAHGGHLRATDNADGGCTFHFSLPRHTELTGV